MTYIPKNREEAINRAGVVIIFVDRAAMKAWKAKHPKSIEHLFTGFYYHTGQRDPMTWHGPFRSWSGAAQSAYVSLRVERHPANAQSRGVTRDRQFA